MTEKQEEIAKSINSHLPQKIWQARGGWGGFLTFDMGEKIKNPSTDDQAPPYRGSVHLWIYLCDWVLYREDEEILSSEVVFNEKIFNLALSPLNNANLIYIKEVNSDIEITFSNDCKLHLMPNLDWSNEDADLFILYVQNHPTISYSLARGFHMGE